MSIIHIQSRDSAASTVTMLGAGRFGGSVAERGEQCFCSSISPDGLRDSLRHLLGGFLSGGIAARE
jgi:hypothetical protein